MIFLGRCNHPLRGCAVFAVLSAWLVIPTFGGEPTVELIDQRIDGAPIQVKATLDAKGVLQEAGDQPTQTEMVVKAQVIYAERLLSHASAVAPSSGELPQPNPLVPETGGSGKSQPTQPRAHAVRQYEQAKADIQVGTHKEAVLLAQDRAGIAADASGGDLRLWSLNGPLSRRELDLLESTSQSLRVEWLLPGRRVAVGEQWTHPAENLAPFLQLDHIGVNEASSKLVRVEQGMAHIQLIGSVKGRVDGALTKIEITGDYRYDTRWHRITWLQMNLREIREQSATAPALEVVSELRMLIEPPNAAATAALAKSLPTQIAPPKVDDLLLAWNAGDQDLRLVHPRDWISMDERPGQTTLRWIEGDKPRAQCSVSRLKDGPPGKLVELADFQSDIRKALGNEFGEFERAKEIDRGDGYRVLRVAARGTVSELPIRWVYYHVTSPEGYRASLAFTMEGDAETAAAVVAQERQFLATLRLAPSPDSRQESPPSTGAPAETAKLPAGVLPQR